MFHHIALATRDAAATHAFYTGPMGFPLVKVDAIPTPGDRGWAKHFFFDSGQGMIAFWELHDESMPSDFDPSMSLSHGLPEWVNHIAFAASDMDDFEARKQRLLAHGVDVAEIDHDWCRSIYAMDPNGTMVEFCLSTRVLDDEDRAEAERLLNDPAPALLAPKEPIFHLAADAMAAQQG